MRPARPNNAAAFRLGLIAMMLVWSGSTVAQCTNNNTLTGAAINVPCPGSVTVPCVQGGQYALVNVTLGNIYTFSTCSGFSFDTEITLFNNVGGVALGYNDDACFLQSTVVWTATFSGQLRVLVDQFPCASNAICIPLTAACAAPPPPVSNNNPCQAINIVQTASCVPQTFSNVGANLTTVPVIPAPGCGNMLAGSADVWFTFTAPPSGISIIETSAGTMVDGAMALYTASACAGTYNLVQCDDDSGPGFMPFLSFNNLIPGQVYYLRFWGYGVATGTFSLCIHGPTTLPAGNCVYELQLFDAFGDGWGGSFVTVTVNGVPYGTYTCNNAYNVYLIGVNIGQVLVVQYTIVGAFEGDNLYTLSYLSTNQTVFNSGTPPTSGVVYSTTVTCAPPPPAQEDCIGGITLCNNQGINNNTNNTGSVADLNASNYGCLLAAEQQGTWYNFVIATGGTLGMSITPVGAIDYDWAIWGPFPPGSTANAICPPIGQPVRCSFASGLDSFTATGSYVTGMATPNPLWATPQFGPPLPSYSDPAGTGDGWTPGINVTAGQVYLMYISNFSNTGQAFNLSWQLGSGASLDCTVLPIELLSFEAKAAGDNVLVRWSTATEQGTSHFTVERSADGLGFTPIGTLNAAGNSSSTIDYHLIDRSPLWGLNYYRLQGSDLDGSHSYSQVKVVSVGSDGTIGGPFPDPVENDAWWLLPTGMDVRTVDVIDALGRVEYHVPLAEFSNGLVHLRADAIPAGTYVLAAFSEDGTALARVRFIKR